MRKAVGLGLSAAAIFATGLTMPAASAAVTSTAAVNAPAPGGPGDPDTTVTFAVTSGALTMTAPSAANLGSGAPGTTISGEIGATTVTDDRALLSASWVADASSTDFTTGAATPDETIPVTDATYAPGTITTTGGITATPHDVTLDGESQAVVTGTAGVGNNTASWNPTVAVAVPVQAVTAPTPGRSPSPCLSPTAQSAQARPGRSHRIATGGRRGGHPLARPGQPTRRRACAACSASSCWCWPPGP